MRCINLIYTEDANFIMMTRQLGNNTASERKKVTSNLGNSRGAAGNSFRFDQLMGKNKTGLR